MVKLVLALIFGGVIVLLASSNSHMVETRLGPLVVVAPHFVVLGTTFFLGFAVAVLAVLKRAVTGGGKEKKTGGIGPQGRSIIIRK